MVYRILIPSALLALLVASTVLAGLLVSTGIQAVMDPTTTLASWTRLPGDRALWLGKRPACSPAVTPLGCRFAGLSADAHLRLIYYPPTADPVAYTVRLPPR